MCRLHRFWEIGKWWGRSQGKEITPARLDDHAMTPLWSRHDFYVPLSLKGQARVINRAVV